MFDAHCYDLKLIGIESSARRAILKTTFLAREPGAFITPSSLTKISRRKRMLLLPERVLFRKTLSRRRVPLKHFEAKENPLKTKEEQKNKDLRATRKSQRWSRKYLGSPASRRIPVRAVRLEKRLKRLRVKRRRVKLQETLEKTPKPKSELFSTQLTQKGKQFPSRRRFPVSDLVSPIGLHGRLGKHPGKYLQENIPE